MRQIRTLELLKCKTAVIVYKYSEIVSAVNELPKILNDKQAIMVSFEIYLRQIHDIMSLRYSMGTLPRQDFMSMDKSKQAQQQTIYEQEIRQINIL